MSDDLQKQLADLKAKHEALEKEHETLKAKPKDPPPKKEEPPADDPELLAKAQKEREALNKKTSDTKTLEAALKFSLTSEKWLKDHGTLLPNDVQDLFTQAEKENYGDAVQKASAIKAGIVQSFFSIQANVDLLTPGLKSALEDFLKLTKNGKQEKATHIFETVFEPAFEMLKRVKKAEHLNKGLGDGSDDAYKNKLMNLSKKHYMGEKANA